MNFRLPYHLFVFALLGFLLPSKAGADEAAERILAGVRHGVALQEGELTGYMRRSGKRTPLTMRMREDDISFQFYHEKKWTGFMLKMNEGNAKLFELNGGKAAPFPKDKIGEPILGSDVTYEDLSLRFLYWKESTVEGEETIKTQKTYKIRLVNPDESGIYGIVYIWVHQKYGALMQVAGYARNGNLLKRFHVTELMKIGKQQTLKKMNVETYQPGTDKVIGVTYLEFEKPKKKGL